MRSVRSRLSRPPVVALVVAAATLAVLYGPDLVSDRQGPVAMSHPLFPRTIAPYSWFVGMASGHRMAAAALLYQNGFGVESMDDEQAVLLGADGSTYRRLDEAEAASVASDQGDPANSVLSPDGTFVVVGSSAPTGKVEVVTLADGRRRSVPTLGGHATLPLAMGADGRTVLLATSLATVDRYTDGGRGLGLASLDLATGTVREYPTITEVEGAALSPDGSRIAVAGHGATRVIDKATGAVRLTFPDLVLSVLDGDAWSPDGRRLALAGRSLTEPEAGQLAVVDVTGAEASPRLLPLGAASGASRAIGWRDDATVLVHTLIGNEDNTSSMLWVDAATGAQTSFATYRPDWFTGAAMGPADAARDLVETWRVADRPVDQGPWPLPLGLGASVLAGLLALVLAQAWSQTTIGSMRGVAESDPPAARSGPLPAG